MPVIKTRTYSMSALVFEKHGPAQVLVMTEIYNQKHVGLSISAKGMSKICCAIRSWISSADDYLFPFFLFPFSLFLF